MEKGNNVVKSMYICPTLSLVGILALAGCRTVPEPKQPLQLGAAQESGDSPTLTVESLDNSIPLGDSFPVSIKIANTLPNDEIALEIIGGGIIPSVTKITVTTDSLGNAQVKLSARATKPKLDTLDVIGYGSGDLLMGTLYVNFEEPYVEDAELQVQSSDAIGEPLTIDEYYDTLPVATSVEEIETFNENPDPPAAYVLDDVSFENEDGGFEEPLDAVVFDTGMQNVDTTASTAGIQEPLTAQACTVEQTFITLKTTVDGNAVNFPKSTRVRVDTGSGPVQVRYVGDYGRVEFNFGCNNYLTFAVDAWTKTGMFMHTGESIEGLIIWKRGMGTNLSLLTADTVRGTVVQMAPTSISNFNRSSQRLFWRINQVYQWELNSHSLYDSFPLDTFYPYLGSGGLAGVGRMHIPAAGSLIDYLIFHEFGHEVYYRRMLGGSEYNRLHQNFIFYGRITYPLCLDALGWSMWNNEGNCAGMLEGFAVWFDAVATRALGTRSRTTDPSSGGIHPEIKPTGSQYNTGSVTPGRVAQFLLDVTDVHGASGVLPNSEPEYIDPVKQFDQSISVRYRNVAQFFYSRPIETSFDDIWRYGIKPRLTSDQLDNYCASKDYNGMNYPNDGC